MKPVECVRLLVRIWTVSKAIALLSGFVLSIVLAGCVSGGERSIETSKIDDRKVSVDSLTETHCEMVTEFEGHAVEPKQERFLGMTVEFEDDIIVGSCRMTKPEFRLVGEKERASFCERWISCCVPEIGDGVSLILKRTGGAELAGGAAVREFEFVEELNGIEIKDCGIRFWFGDDFIGMSGLVIAIDEAHTESASLIGVNRAREALAKKFGIVAMSSVDRISFKYLPVKRRGTSEDSNGRRSFRASYVAKDRDGIDTHLRVDPISGIATLEPRHF